MHFLFSWPAQLMFSQRMSALVGAWDAGNSLGRQVWRKFCDPLRMGLKRKGRTEQVCYRSATDLWMKLGRLGLRSSRRGVGQISPYLLP